MQGSGVDRKIVFKDGTCLYMEEKLAKKESNKMFVEVFDNTHEDDKGWFYTINPELCKYLVYGYKDTLKFYFIPFKEFKQKFMPIFEKPDCPYRLIDKHNKTGNRTKGWLVPWKDIESKIQGFKCIKL